MTEENQQKYALMRYSILFPVISSTLPEETTVKDFLAEAAKQTYADPDGRPHHYSASTLERWLYRYRKFGLDGLTLKNRSDAGSFRKVDEDILEKVKQLKSQHPRMPSTEILKQLVSDGIITNGDISLSTITRCVHHVEESEKFQTHDELRRYERPHINEVWCGDSCVGPVLKMNGEKRRIFVIALIDDASRFITGAKVFFQDDYVSLCQVIRSAVLKYGIPKVFNFDNGHSYKNLQMELLAARLGSAIHYCQPYTPIQKSKIERWFRTLRDKWLATTDLSLCASLEAIQASLNSFVTAYNQTVHSSLNGKTPEERFFSEQNLIRRIESDHADNLFLLEIGRKSSLDGVISINDRQYEVDSRFANQHLKLRYSADMSEIYVVDSDGSLVPIRCLNKEENSQIKRKKVYLSGGEQ